MPRARPTAGTLWYHSPLPHPLPQSHRSSPPCHRRRGQLATAYSLAVAVGCGIGLGLRRLVQATPRLARLGILVPYTAVVAAGASNVALTRSPEIASGVPISTPSGEVLGVSRRAAVESVALTILSRVVFLPVVPMLVPPLLMSACRSVGPLRSLLRVGSPAAVVAETTLVAGSISFALPPCIALFPQQMAISTSRLEPEFQNRIDRDGKPVDHVVCNKGL